MLIFLAAVNLAGFTLLPYFLSRTDSINPSMPLTSTHKVYTLMELVFLSLVLAPLNGSELTRFAYLLSVFCYLNYFFDFRYLINCLFKMEKVHVYWPNLKNDAFMLRRYEYSMNEKLDLGLFYMYNQNRVVLDFALFLLLISVLI